MNKQTQMLLLMGLGAAALYFFVVKKPQVAGQLAGPTAGGMTDAQAAARIAEANAEAAQAQADAAVKIAEAQQGEWYTPILQGIGKGTEGFLSGIGGIW